MKVDHCRTLNINRMIETGAIKSGATTYGSWVWTDSETGEQKASISYHSNTCDIYNAFLKLNYTLTDRGEAMNYNIPLIATKAHFGGVRFWFKCPLTGRKASKLYLPYGANFFACRQAYRLKYASQSQSYENRVINKKWKIVRKTGGYNYPIRPKGMHDKTFERILDKYWAQEELCDELLAYKLSRLMGI